MNKVSWALFFFNSKSTDIIHDMINEPVKWSGNGYYSQMLIRYYSHDQYNINMLSSILTLSHIPKQLRSEITEQLWTFGRSNKIKIVQSKTQIIGPLTQHVEKKNTSFFGAEGQPVPLVRRPVGQLGLLLSETPRVSALQIAPLGTVDYRIDDVRLRSVGLTEFKYCD